MMKQTLIKHILVTDVMLILALVIYDLLSLVIPVVRVRFWFGLLILIGIDLVLILNNYLRTNR